MTPFTNSLIALAILNTVQGSLSPTFPVQGSTCAVLQSCQIKWQDDSNLPSTTTMGETTIDLVMGNASNLQAVQNLGGVMNPSVATAITFQPIAGLSPTEKYAVRFIAKGNASHPIFSTYFTITGGSGTAKPLATPNSALAASNPSSPSSGPSAIIGSKAPTGGSNASTPSNVMTASTNTTASDNAGKSPASVVGPSYTVFAGMAAAVASLCFL